MLVGSLVAAPESGTRRRSVVGQMMWGLRSNYNKFNSFSLLRAIKHWKLNHKGVPSIGNRKMIHVNGAEKEESRKRQSLA